MIPTTMLGDSCFIGICTIFTIFYLYGTDFKFLALQLAYICTIFANFSLYGTDSGFSMTIISLSIHIHHNNCNIYTNLWCESFYVNHIITYFV